LTTDATIALFGLTHRLFWVEMRNTKFSFYTVLFFLLLLVVWVVFSGLLDPFHLTLGVISCGLVTWISSDLLFADRGISLRRRLVQGRRLTAYVAWLLWQLVLANIHMFKLAFAPKSQLQPQIVRYRTGLKSDFEKFLLANSITLTPGTVTIKILKDTFYIHAISDFAAGGLDGEMERRIAFIFETSEEISTASDPVQS
jgi:multicomponent Na+:H+ antiporter subunit E